MTERIPLLLFAGLLWASLSMAGEGPGTKPKPAPAPAPAPAPKAEPKPKAAPAPEAKPAPAPKAEPKPKAKPVPAPAPEKPAPAPAPAPEKPAPAPAPATSSGADVPTAISDDPGAFVEMLYKRLEGQRRDDRLLVLALDPGLLLERAIAGLPTRPPKVWMAAARKRLAASRTEAIATIFPPEMMVISPRMLGVQSEKPDRALVGVRFYAFHPGTGAGVPVWHQVHLVRSGSGWLLADIDALQGSGRLSDLALILLTDLEQEPLPLEGSGILGSLALKSVVPGLLVALLLGLGTYFVLVRPTAKGKPGRGLKLFLMWIVIVGPLLAGLVLFAAGLMDHLDRNGAVDTVARRGASMRLTTSAQQDLLTAQMLKARRRPNDAQKAFRQAMNSCDRAVAPGAWPDNRAAMLLSGRLLAAVGDRNRREADNYLKALTSPDMQPPMPAAHLLRASFCERHKQWSEAGSATLSFIKLIGEDAFSYVRAAKSFAKAGDFKSADEMLRRAEKIEKFDQSMLMDRIEIRATEKRADDVIADIKSMMAPVSKDLGSTLITCQQILGMARDGKFNKLLEDAKFQAYMDGLSKTRNGAVSKLLDSAAEHATGGRAVEATRDLAVLTKVLESDDRSFIAVCQQISRMALGGKFQKVSRDPIFLNFMRNLQARVDAALRRMRGGGHR